MSESNEKLVSILNNIGGLSISSKDSLEAKELKAAAENMSAEVSSSVVEIPDAASAENSASEGEIAPLTAIHVPTELNSTKSECIIKTDHSREDDSFSKLIAKGDINSAIENIRKAMKENEILLEQSLRYSSDFLKSLPKNAQYSTISSMRRVRENSTSDTLSNTSEGESEISFEVKRLLANKCSNSSGYFSPISSQSVTPVSTAESNDFAERSLATASGKTSIRSDSLETLVTDRPPSALPYENVSNSFCYSFITRKIRRHYNSLFDFPEFKHARSLNSNAYRKLLNIKYICLPLSRYLMEDLLDFVDFLNGTGMELREPESGLCPSNYEYRKLAYIRENFFNGVQQLESRTVCDLLEELYNYYGLLATTKEPSDGSASTQGLPDSSESQQSKDSDPEVTPKCSDLRKQSRKSYELFSLEKYRIFRLEPEMEHLDCPSVAQRLESLKVSVQRLMIRCISDTRMVLDICIHTKYNVLSQRLISYLSGIECLLHRLVLLREDCGMLLGDWNGQVDNTTTLHILRVKLQVASEFQRFLFNFSEINSKFLEN